MPTPSPTETTLHPPGTQRRNTVVVEQPLTKYQALRQIGFFSGFDFVILALVGLCFTTLIFWGIFALPSLLQIAVCLLACAILLQVWAISLVYRCMHFVVMTQSYIHTLPEDAAKIVMAAYSGGTQGGTK